jgi:hypothetical protein
MGGCCCWCSCGILIVVVAAVFCVGMACECMREMWDRRDKRKKDSCWNGKLWPSWEVFSHSVKPTTPHSTFFHEVVVFTQSSPVHPAIPAPPPCHCHFTFLNTPAATNYYWPCRLHSVATYSSRLVSRPQRPRSMWVHLSYPTAHHNWYHAQLKKKVSLVSIHFCLTPFLVHAQAMSHPCYVHT